MNSLKLVAPTATLLLLSSCASELKRRCQATNWFEHGQAVALSGRRLSADNFIDQCKKEKVQVDEAQADLGFKAGMGRYCTAEGATDTGRKGDVFNPELCDPAVATALRKDYDRGVEAYCRPKNAYEQGALGNVYKNVCPDRLEDAFLKEYNRGRRVYFTNMIQAKEFELKAAQNAVEESQRSESRLNTQLTALMAAQTLAMRRNPSPELEAKFESDKNDLQSRIYQESSRRRAKEQEVQRLRSEIADLRVKLGAAEVEN